MAKVASITDGNVVKTRKARSPSEPKKVYVVLQVLDEEGNPTRFEKSRVRLVSFERSGEHVLDKIEGGGLEHAFYLRGTVPVGRS